MRAYEMVIYRDMNQDEIFSNLCQVIGGYKKMEKVGTSNWSRSTIEKESSVIARP